MSRNTTNWLGHVGHRLTAGYADGDGGRDVFTPPVACLFCKDCGVQLDAARVERDPAAGRGESLRDSRPGTPTGAVGGGVVEELVGVIAGLHSGMMDERDGGQPASPFAGFCTQTDAYWAGYRDGTRSGRELVYAHLARCLEDVAASHMACVDRSVAWRTVRAAVLDRLRLLRPQAWPRVSPPAEQSKAKNAIPDT